MRRPTSTTAIPLNSAHSTAICCDAIHISMCWEAAAARTTATFKRLHEPVRRFRRPSENSIQHAREPGDLWSASDRKETRPVREGAKPEGGRARSGGVGPHHTIDEPDEQRRAIFGGAWGEKGAGQGEHRSVQHEPDTVRGSECSKDCAVCE